jgi:hypothetical protein
MCGHDDDPTTYDLPAVPDPDDDNEYPEDCVCGHGYDEHSVESQLCTYFPYGCLCYHGYRPQEQPIVLTASPDNTSTQGQETPK